MHAGEYILRTRPDAVVVETSVTHEHGAVPGNGISCSSELVQGPEAFFVRMFCQLAEQLNAEGADPTNSGFWQQVGVKASGTIPHTPLRHAPRGAHSLRPLMGWNQPLLPARVHFQIKEYYRGEQLAYICAFATGAKLVFADRPKDISYR